MAPVPALDLTTSLRGHLAINCQRLAGSCRRFGGEPLAQRALFKRLSFLKQIFVDKGHPGSRRRALYERGHTFCTLSPSACKARPFMHQNWAWKVLLLLCCRE